MRRLRHRPDPIDPAPTTRTDQQRKQWIDELLAYYLMNQSLSGTSTRTHTGARLQLGQAQQHVENRRGCRCRSKHDSTCAQPIDARLCPSTEESSLYLQLTCVAHRCGLE